MGWMPATHLISVDFPAPLSPTSAITSPARTSKSTSVSACTEPKLFVIPLISSSGARSLSASGSAIVGGVSGATAIVRESFRERGRSAGEGAPPASALAVLRVLARADLGLLQEAVGDEQLPVVLRDRDRGQEHRRDLGGPVVGRLALRVDRLAMQDPVGDGRGRV